MACWNARLLLSERNRDVPPGRSLDFAVALENILLDRTCDRGLQNGCIQVRYLGAHRTPSDDVRTWQIPADYRPVTICAMCRCRLVCPLTIVRFGKDICGLWRCYTARTSSHIAGSTVGDVCSYGGISCRAIH
jgi:hypothetical protein